VGNWDSEPNYDYVEETNFLINNLATVLTDQRKTEIEFFDDKLAVGIAIISAIIQT
jgi:hypothetical protein